MKSLKVSGHIAADGHLRLDVPTDLEPGEVELLLVVNPLSGKARRYDFSDLAGRLSWAGDALAEQRKLRDEW